MEPSAIPEGCARRFRVQRPIAEGGFGAVYEAVQVDLGRHVALKVLKSAAFEQDNAVERFLREAKGTAALEHPHIVRIYDHGIEDGVPWIAYEFMGGGTLTGQMKPGPIEWRRAIWIVRQICLGLEHAHAANILHRDMKPANVLFAESGQVKVADFGLAKWNSQATILTETGAVLGTPYYMAPELLNGEAGFPSDQYAVAVLFFEMITGRRLFIAETPVQVLLKHANADRPAPSTIVDVPPELDAVVLRGLARLPGDRHSSLAAFRVALEALAPESTGSSPYALPPIKPARQTGRKPISKPAPAVRVSAPPPASPQTRWGLVGGAILAGALVGFGISRLRVAPVDPVVIARAERMLASAGPGVDLERLERERAELRARSDELGLIGVQMWQAVRPGSAPATMREPMEKTLAGHREIVRRAEAALEPLEASTIRAGIWPHRVTEVAARLATLALMSRMDVDRGNRFLPRLSERGAGEFLGTSVDLMLSQQFSRPILGDLHRQHDWVAALAVQAALDPAAAGPHTVWAILDMVRAAKQFSQTPIEGYTSKELIAHARDRFAKTLRSESPHGAALARLAPALFTVGVQGNVAASAAMVDQIAADAGVLEAAMPNAAAAFRSLPLRVRSLYPPRGAPGATLTPDWPFAP